MIFEYNIPCFDDAGAVLTSIRLAAEGSTDSALIVDIPEDEAEQYGEASIQIYEGHQYQYELQDPGYKLECDDSLLQRLLIGRRDVDQGILYTGNRAGLLKLKIYREDCHVATASVEVRSLKLGYRDDYKNMLEDIAQYSIDLLMDIKGITESNFIFNLEKDRPSLQQTFFFIRGLLESEEFRGGLSQILSMPHSSLIRRTEERQISRGVRFTQENYREFSAGSSRIKLPVSHPLHKSMSGLGVSQPSLPSTLIQHHSEETYDTLENRFVKYVLEHFLATILAIGDLFSADDIFYDREVLPLRRFLEETLSSPFFRDISRLNILPLNSPTLQRRSGYREIYRAWLSFDLAGQLSWQGGEDSYGGGKRDVATLYEYWLFFILFRTVCELSDGTERISFKNILEKNRGGYGLRLKSGVLLEVGDIRFSNLSEPLQATFSYNRTFSSAPTRHNGGRLDYKVSYPHPGSWTRSMRPDFTLSFWPQSMTEAQAEEKELISHVHFDAKYSVSSLRELFGSADENVSSDKMRERSGAYKRADLLKMHAYRDSIRRSEGAYILYPGVSEGYPAGAIATHDIWLGFHEILPGLGAFTLRPGKDCKAGVRTIKIFLEDIIDHLGNKSLVSKK